MTGKLRWIAAEAWTTLAHPSRLKRLDRKRLDKIRRRLLVRVPEGGDWQSLDQSGFTKRSYRTYDEYVAHQCSKLAVGDFRDIDEALKSSLVARFHTEDWRGKRVLCLGARLGGEVRAFLEMGAFAVGVDLEPGAHNRYVVTGDFHALQFNEATVDVIYTNSLDHALEVERAVAEVLRVLVPGGRLFVDAAPGRVDAEPSHWEAAIWETTEDLVAAIERIGLKLSARTVIESPWGGTQLVFLAPN